MNPTPRSRYRLLLRASLAALPVSLIFPLAQTARAADGTWNTTTSGALWSLDTNWSSNAIADGSGSTAFFNNVDIPASTVIVNLDTARTIGNLIFGDTTNTTVGAWVLANNGSSPNILTLAGTTPTITVNDLGAGGYATTGGSIAYAGSSGASTVTISAVIDGTAGLTKVAGSGATVANASTAGRGVLVLSGTNTYSGGTTISSGALAAASSSALGSGAVTVTSGAQLQIRGVSIANTININGSSALFSSSVSNSNLTGIVNLQSNSGIGLATNNGNATLTLSGTLNLSSFALSIGGSGSNAVTISAAVNGSGGITNSGSNTLTLSNNNTGYSGTTTISGNGTVLQVGNDGALGSGTLAFGFNGGPETLRSTDGTARTLSNALVLNGNATSIYTFGAAATQTGNLTFTNTAAIALSTIRTFNVLNSTQFNAGFTGAGGITKTGAGTLVLAGAGTYTGATKISAGILALGANNAFAVSNFELGGGTLGVGTFTNTAVGTLALTGNSIITLGSGGAFAFADSDALNWGSNTLSITGTFLDGFSIRFGTDATGLTGTQLALISINGGAASINSSGYLVASA
ncbi:MAG TPA: autotransporter-associated beta strand repeat-containing protein, partial [Roseimicrobium sp.]|nr:autotransporter-associated beta strand repeat-containing protein [Roseimicrobium sp.]